MEKKAIREELDDHLGGEDDEEEPFTYSENRFLLRPDWIEGRLPRHRAAIGLTEQVDAVVIVVSEETGRISVVVGGNITRDLEVTTLKKVLKRLLESRRLRGKKS